MKIITKAIDRLLVQNHATDSDAVKPPLKLFLPWCGATWLIADRDPADPDLLFGLCDLGHGSPELGYVRLSEIQSVRRFGLGVERDRHFSPKKTLAEYADEARQAGRIAA